MCLLAYLKALFKRDLQEVEMRFQKSEVLRGGFLLRLRSQRYCLDGLVDLLSLWPRERPSILVRETSSLEICALSNPGKSQVSSVLKMIDLVKGD